MNRSSNFLIALAAAIITFGALTLIFGPKHTVWARHHNGWYGARGHDHNDHQCFERDQRNQNENSKKEEAE
jgi:hypothetical protein